LPIRKAANAFLIEFSDSVFVQALVSSYAHEHGGVWVGGTATLSADGLKFQTNRANRLLHGRRADFTLGADRIEDVVHQPALVSSMVAVRADTALVQIRCFGAADFGAAIASVATLARWSAGAHTNAVVMRELDEGRFRDELLEILQRLLEVP
jgi:hypothetical protein